MTKAQGTENNKNGKPATAEEKLIARILFTLISATFVGLGALPIITGHYYGVSTRHGYHELVLNGDPAILMGVGLVFLGLMPMAIWLKTKTHVILWMLVSLFFSALGFIASAKV